jgi:hypothetical protein
VEEVRGKWVQGASLQTVSPGEAAAPPAGGEGERDGGALRSVSQGEAEPAPPGPAHQVTPVPQGEPPHPGGAHVPREQAEESAGQRAEEGHGGQ